MALARINRLPGNIRMRNPRTYSTRAFLLKVGANNAMLTRFGFIIPKTIDKRAVMRNKIRRLFQSCVGRMVEKIQPGYDMLFIIRPQARDLDQAKVCKVMQSVFVQGGLL